MLGPLPINLAPGFDEGKVFGENTQPVYLVSNGKQTVVALGGFRGQPGDSLTLDTFNRKGKLVKEGALVPRLWRSETGGQVWTSVDLPPGILRPGATVTFLTTPSGKELLCIIGGLKYCSNAANLRAAYLTTQEVQCTPDLGTMWTDFPGLRNVGGLAFASPVQGPFGVWLVGGIRTNKCVKLPACTQPAQPSQPLPSGIPGELIGSPTPSSEPCISRSRALVLEESSDNLVPWGGIVAAVFDTDGSSIVDWIVVKENVTALGVNRMFPAVTYSSYQQSLYMAGGMTATEADLLGGEGDSGGGDGSDGDGGLDGGGWPGSVSPRVQPTESPADSPSSGTPPSVAPQARSSSPEASSSGMPSASSTVNEGRDHHASSSPSATHSFVEPAGRSTPSGTSLPVRRGRALHLTDLAAHAGAEENTDLIALRFPARALEAPDLSERWARHRNAAKVPANYLVLPRTPELLEFGMEPGALLLEVLSVRGVGFLPLNMSLYPPLPENATDAAGIPLKRFQEDLPLLVLVVNGKVYSSSSFGLSGWVKLVPFVYPRPDAHGDSQIMIRAPVVLQARPQMEHAKGAFFFAGVSMGAIESERPTTRTAGLFAYGYPNVRCLSPCSRGEGEWSWGCQLYPDDAVCQQCDATAPHESGGSCKEGFTYWLRPCGVANGSFGWPVAAECMPCQSCAQYYKALSPCGGPNNTVCAFVPERERLETARNPTAIAPPLVVSSRLNDSTLMPIVVLGLLSWMVAFMALTLRLLGSRSIRGALQGLGAGTVLCREGITLPAAPGKGAQDLFQTLASALLFLFGLVLQATAGFYLMAGAMEKEELWPVASRSSRSLGGALLGLMVVGCVLHSAVMILVYRRGSLVKYGLLARTQEGCAAASDVAVLTMHPRTALLCVLKLTRGAPDKSLTGPGTGAASPMQDGKLVRDPAGAWKVLSYAVSWCRWHQILIDLPSLVTSIICVAGIHAQYGEAMPVSNLVLFVGLCLHQAATLLYTTHVLTLANTRHLVLRMSGAGGLVHDMVASGGVGHVENSRARLGESSGGHKEGGVLGGENEGVTTTTTTPLTVLDVHQRAGRAIKLSQGTTTVHSSMLGATLSGESVTTPLAPHVQASKGATSKRGSIPTATGASSLTMLALPADVQMSLYAGAGTVEGGTALVTSARDQIISTQRSSVTAGPAVTVNAHIHMEAYDGQWNDSASATAMVDEHHPRAAYPASAQSHAAEVWGGQVALGDAGSAVSAAGGRASCSSSDEMEGSTTAVLGGVSRLVMGGKGSLMVFTSSQAAAQQTVRLMAPQAQQRLTQLSAVGPSSMSSFHLPPPADGASAGELERRPGSVPLTSISSSLPPHLNEDLHVGVQAPRAAPPPLPVPFSSAGRHM